MSASAAERSWLRGVLIRASVLGASTAIVALAGGTHVMSRSVGTVSAPVLIATVLLAFGVGAWAAVPERDAEVPKLRERWLSAAALTAVGASFTAVSNVYEQLYPGIPSRIGDVLFTVALPLYGLGLVGPALIDWAERTHDSISEDAGPWTVFGTLAAGAIVASILAVLAAGILILPGAGPGPVLMTAVVLLLLPMALPDPAGNLPRESLLLESFTPFGSLRVTEVVFPGDRQPERRLYLNDEEESAQLVRTGTPTLGYIAAAESWLSAITPPGSSFLFLGGGAYTLPRRLMERDARARVAVVELDPEVTRIAYRFFGLSPHHGITSFHGDARAFLNRPGGRVDRLYVDVYGGSEALPFSLTSREAAGKMAERLNPEGVVALNVIGKVVGEERRQLWSVVRTFAEVFPNLALYTHLGRDFPDRQNLLLAASPDPSRSFPNAAGHFELWPRDEWPRIEGTLVFRDLLPEPGSGADTATDAAPAPSPDRRRA